MRPPVPSNGPAVGPSSTSNILVWPLVAATSGARLVPFPLARFGDQEVSTPLARLADRIPSLQAAWRKAGDEGSIASVAAAFTTAWAELDRARGSVPLDTNE